jgi:CHAT domain
MISAPSDRAGLSGEDEWHKLNDALRDLAARGMVQVDRLEIGSLPALQPTLRRHDYHVLHFVGHGYYDKDAEDGALALEGADGSTRLVTGRDLGLMLRGHRSLRLVVLNACEGARSARDDPFGGVSQALARQGIPAVIAMQFEISDAAAVVFGHSFYQAIADGLPVDLAMVEARRAMWAEGHEVEWATPVLNLRSPDGRIFTRSRVTGASRPAQEKAATPAPQKARRPAQEKAASPAPRETGRPARAAAARTSPEERRQQEYDQAWRQKRAAVSTGRSGNAAGARDQLAALLLQREKKSHVEDPLTLGIRSDLAEWTGRAGDPAGARDQFAELVPVCERVLGLDAIDTVGDLGKFAYWSGEAGDAAGARDQYAALLPVLERTVGPEHRHVLVDRESLAYWTEQSKRFRRRR